MFKAILFLIDAVLNGYNFESYKLCLKERYLNFNVTREIQMNKLIKGTILAVVLVLSLSVVACKNNSIDDEKQEETKAENPSTTEAVTQKTEEEQAQILAEFIQMTENPETGISNLIAYLDQSIPFLSDENVDAMLNAFEAVHIMQTWELDSDFMTEESQTLLASFRIDDLKSKNITDEKVLALLNKIETMGYKIEQVEGFIGPFVDYGFYLKYADYGTESCQKYFYLMKTESDLPAVFDMGLVISWEELINRTVAVDEFITLYPESIFYDNAKMMLQGYMDLFFNGTLNVTAYDESTLKMNENLINAITHYEFKNQNLKIVEVIRMYQDLLTSSEYTKNSEIEQFIQETIENYN